MMWCKSQSFQNKRDRMRSHQYNNNIKINEQKEQWKENKMAVQGLLLTWTFDLDQAFKARLHALFKQKHVQQTFSVLLLL